MSRRGLLIGGGDGYIHVDMGDLEWIYEPSRVWFRHNFSREEMAVNPSWAQRSDIICDAYEQIVPNDIYTISHDKKFSAIPASSTIVYFVVRDTDYTDAETFRQAVAGKMIRYKHPE